MLALDFPQERLTEEELFWRIQQLPLDGQIQAQVYLQQLGFIEKPGFVYSDDPEIREIQERYRWDVGGFADAFFPHLCTSDFSTMHQDFFDRWERLKDQRGIREATAAPRGNAKTTIRTTIKTCHDAVYGHERFILIISARYDMSIERVEDIREELEENELLLRVYGIQKGKTWNKGNIITRYGVRIMSASRGQQVRGLVRRGSRPTKVVLDDAERSDEVNSETQRDKFWRWLQSDVMKLGTTGYTNYEIVGTILHPESALNRLLANPGWTPSRYKSVIRYADQAPELWQQWRSIYIGEVEEGEELPDRDDARMAAKAFFEVHQELMLAGSKVLWPEGEPYYDLMEMILVEGVEAFETEKQNNPFIAERYPFDMENAGYFTIEPDRLIRHGIGLAPVLLSDLIDIAAFWDPALGGKEGDPDWSACVIVAKDRRGFFYVLDAYISQHEEPDIQVKGVAEMLVKWKVPKIALETNNFQSLLVSDLREEMAQRFLEEQEHWALNWYNVKNVRNKVLRIMTLQPYVSNRWLWFNTKLHPEAKRQMKFFRPLPDAGKDDFPDATEGALRCLRGLLDRMASP